MAPRPRPRTVAVPVALLLGAPALGACSDDGASEDDFAEGTCDVLVDLVGGFQALEADVRGLAGAEPSTLEEAEALLADVQVFFDDAIELLEAARDGIQDVDGSGVDEGEEFVEVFADSLADAVATLEEAQATFDLDAEALAGLDSEAAARFAELGDTLGESFTGAFAPMEEARFEGLGRLVEDAEGCRELGSGS